MPSLMIDHLSINLRSGTDNLVSEISFAIKEGESLILLGQSGSGKTMTCSAVLPVQLPTQSLPPQLNANPRRPSGQSLHRGRTGALPAMPPKGRRG